MAHPDYTGITTVIMDIDGVLTNGMVLCFDAGARVRQTYNKDAYAIQFAVKMGYRLAVISGSNAEGVKTRMEALGVRDILLRASYKLEVYESYKAQVGFRDEEVVYIGDDMPDYDVMKHVRLGIAPADAAEDILAMADYVTRSPGGRGCVREVIEAMMKQQQTWDTHVNKHW